MGALRSCVKEKSTTEARRHKEIFFSTGEPFISCLGALSRTDIENHRPASAKQWLGFDRYRSRRYSARSSAAHSAGFLVPFSPRSGEHAHRAAGRRPGAVRAHLRFLITADGRTALSYQPSAISKKKKNSRARAAFGGTQPAGGICAFASGA